MNYQSLVKKDKKNKVAITVLSIVLVVAVLVASFAILSRGFTKLPETWLKKDLPTSTFVLGITSIDELINVPFTTDTFSFTGTDKDINDNTYSWAIINLSVDGFSEEFTPLEEESYRSSFHINDSYYTCTSIEDNVEKEWTFAFFEEGDIVGFLRITNYAYLKADGAIFIDAPSFDGEVTHYGDNIIIPGYSVQIYYFEAEDIYDFEILSFEKVE